MQRGPVGRFGDYSCDASWDLIESAAHMMKSRPNVNVEFVLWTGDSLSHSTKHHQDINKLELLQNITDLLHKTFSSQFVFPALGHDDPSSRKKMGEMWSRWFPADSLKTFVQGGYYIIERKTEKLQIVVLNTNLMRKADNDPEAARQWEWLEGVMKKLKRNMETAYLVGHMAPGCDERQRTALPGTHSQAFTDFNNKKYLELIRKYSELIVGQFFGHLHSDTFRVIYNERGHPTSWAMLAPALTPRRLTDGPNNPGIRLYKYNQNTGQILDYTQYYLDLSAAKEHNHAEWAVEYNFSTHYMINNITPLALHNLAEKLSNASGDNPTFNRYYRANSVRFHNNQHSTCDATCAHTHYCAITRVDYHEHEQCLKTAASVVSSYSLTSTPLNCFSLLSLFVIFKVR
ncbi:acid sphingomyelinase-like phosphodiesterase 3b isoform X2 [Coccinella septempunctata]|nr:acid sphingomyelinase-like phosphodiesterase 3b isoform X2 [Coccinella septempunctata]